MVVRHGKEFTVGLILTVSFFIVLVIMFCPYFGGENAFHAADRLFNKISKGSSYFIPEVMKKIETVKLSKGATVETVLPIEPEYLRANIQKILSTHGVTVWTEGNSLHIRGDLGIILAAAVTDADDMYYNRGEAIRERYGIEERQATFAWWKTLGAMNKELAIQKKFKWAKLTKEVQTKAVEVGYNYYGIIPRHASEKAGTLTFSLIFYVLYTMWWGYAILMLFEGIGLEMKAGAKKEV